MAKKTTTLLVWYELFPWLPFSSHYHLQLYDESIRFFRRIHWPIGCAFFFFSLIHSLLLFVCIFELNGKGSLNGFGFSLSFCYACRWHSTRSGLFLHIVNNLVSEWIAQHKSQIFGVYVDVRVHGDPCHSNHSPLYWLINLWEWYVYFTLHTSPFSIGSYHRKYVQTTRAEEKSDVWLYVCWWERESCCVFSVAKESNVWKWKKVTVKISAEVSFHRVVDLFISIQCEFSNLMTILKGAISRFIECFIYFCLFYKHLTKRNTISMLAILHDKKPNKNIWSINWKMNVNNSNVCYAQMMVHQFSHNRRLVTVSREREGGGGWERESNNHISLIRTDRLWLLDGLTIHTGQFHIIFFSLTTLADIIDKV